MKLTTLLRPQVTASLALTLMLALFISAVMVPSMLAQSSGTSGLAGTVTDPSGAAIVGVTVTLTSNATGQVRTASTSADGTYKFSLLPPGDYKVRFAANGFKTSEVGSIALNVTETPALDRVMEVGAQSEQITVEAAAEVLQTESSTLGTVVTSQSINDAPLASRNYTQILNMSAGAVSGVNDATQLGKGTLDMSVNGAAPEQNNFQMDGVSVVNAFGTGIAKDCGIYVGIAIPSPDAIQEFKVQTSTYDASYGRNPGANVNVLTKSGSNAFHGTLFEFLRNEDLDANGFFENAEGTGKEILRQNQFGGTFGGPIKKDKLFFFGSYQGTRQLNGVSSAGSSSVFLPPIPAGDRSAPGFAAALGAADCAANHPGNPEFITFASLFGGQQLACNGSNISPVALAILNAKNPNGSYYMVGSDNGGYEQHTFSIPAKYTGDQYISNVDYIINSKNTLAMRYLFSEDPQEVPFGSGVPGTPIFSYYANTNSVVRLTTLITNNVVNEAHATMQRNIANGTDKVTQYTAQSVGITPIIPTETHPPVTLILNAYGIGGTLSPYYGPATQANFGDQISWSHGKHTLRVGGEYEADQWNLSFKSLLTGFLFVDTFDDFLVGRPGLAGCNVPGGCSPTNPGNTTGAPVGTYLSCLFCVRSGPNGIIHGYREKDVAGFVQDDWKVSSRLTVNLGVRWEYDEMLADHYGNLTNIWPSLMQGVTPPTTPQQTTNALLGYVVPNNFAAHYGAPPPGVKTVNTSAPTQNGTPWNNFGPRFGFAWQPKKDGKLVVRGGVGLFYDRVGSSKFVHAVEQGDPYAVTLDEASPFAAAPYSLANPFPSTPLGFTPRYYNPAYASNCGNELALCTSDINQPFYSQVHTPLSRQYNLGIQYNFASQWVLELGFVGSSGINQADYNHNYNTAIIASANNPVNGQITTTTANADARVPYLGYDPAGLQGTGYDGIYNYNSLQVTVRKQFSHGLTMQAAYTWSKDLTTLNGDGQSNSNDASYLGQQYGPAYFAHPQRFIVSYGYQLPFGHPTNTFLKKLAEDWMMTGNIVVQDGSPLTFTNSAGGSAYGTGSAGTGEGGTARAQLCPGVTYSNMLTSGSLTSRLGGSNSANGYISSTAFCEQPAIEPNGVTVTSQAACPTCATLFGDSGLGIVLGPGNVNWDTSVLKTFHLTEKQTLQFRSDFFNILNHPQFSNPGVAQNATNTFGVITTTAVNPRIIQFALKFLF
jgi:Carboxypeptidase regulatory-like domain/TonB dependent receptor